jgi:cytosine/adenosine deaminase-related metal-dependent hydrolase
MSLEFCVGYAQEPFATLCREYLGSDVYPAADFRLEWGPIFHRGRLNGTARLLVVGQDPAASETFVRRILVGIAGQRTQGFMHRLGLTRSYVLINTFLYSVYGQGGGNRHAKDGAIAQYRDRWIDAILAQGSIEAVIALGELADQAWIGWKDRHPGQPGRDLPYRHITHPTQPDSASGGDPTKQADLTRKLLANWSEALTALHGSIQHPDVATPLRTYGTTWQTDDLDAIPPVDLPPGIPAWMRDQDHWAQRVGSSPALKRANLTITVPSTGMSAATSANANASGATARAITAGASGSPSPATPAVGLRGAVVTMKSPSSGVLADHVVWIEGKTIRDIRPADAPAPAGLEGVKPITTNGYIFPGLIDLHNHLAYDVLPLWDVPRKFTNRAQWSGLVGYRRNVSAPMSTVAKLPGMLPAICRYVECKAIMGGATTSQGIKLVNEAGIATFFRGLLRNVEIMDDPALPSASARIADVAAKDAVTFLAALKREKTCYLLHLSEGTDDIAREHFLALKEKGAQWAITAALSGIHCVALKPADFEVLAKFGASMVWSPTSNLLLYNQTSDVLAARSAGLKIGLGPDWSPSGSKNMLGELKTARLHSQAMNGALSDEAIVAMATREAADILRWTKVGTLAPGNIADLIVVAKRGTDPYKSLIEARETDLHLVMIGGVPRYGIPSIMESMLPAAEQVTVGGQKRSLNLLASPPMSGVPQPIIEELSLEGASTRLKSAFDNVGSNSKAAPYLASVALHLNGGWRLGLDEIDEDGFEMRPLVGLKGDSRRRGVTRPLTGNGPLPASIRLDPLTVADDPHYLGAMKAQKNLPPHIAEGLEDLYS